MVEILYKIKEWFKKLFKKDNLQLPAGTIAKEIIKEENIQKNEFKDNLRTVENEEEKELIKKFENGEIAFKDLTEEILNKINNGYSFEINRNLEKIQMNMQMIKRLKIEVE